MEKIDFKELAARIICFSALGLLLIFFFKYVFVAFVPFLIAWAIALPIYPLACTLQRRTGIPRRACSFVLMLIFLSLIALLLSLIAGKALSELTRLWNMFLNDGDRIILYFRNLFDSFGELPFLQKLEESGLDEKILEIINTFLERTRDTLIGIFGEAIPNFAILTAKKLPSAIFVTVVTVISCFYFSMDVDLVHKFIKSYLPEKTQKHIAFFKKRVLSALKKYLKAYLVIFIITFFELLAGFLILRVNYAILLALAVALVDVLPIFGTGTVLIPWAIVSLITKNYYLGFGLLLLYLAITVARQAIEPKIVGKSMGIHPLLTLVAMYLGFKLFGFLGLVLSPMFITILFSKSEEY